jgi:hypothetical protein
VKQQGAIANQSSKVQHQGKVAIKCMVQQARNQGGKTTQSNKQLI